MIDVPVEVKDALRDGRLKKNIWIELINTETPIDLTNYGVVYAQKTGRYKLYSPVGGFALGIMIGINGGGYWPADPTEIEIVKYFNIEKGTRILTYSPDFEQGEVFLQMIFEPVSGAIDNNNLVSESISIDERMNSGNKIKFGLCEGSSLEFQYFGLPNIRNQYIQLFIDVDYGADEPYPIPMGFYTVEKCSRQASTGIIRATAYNKLQSDFLDIKANELLLQSYDALINEDGVSYATLDAILNKALQSFEITEASYEDLHVIDTGFHSTSIYSYSGMTLYDEPGVQSGEYVHIAYPHVSLGINDEDLEKMYDDYWWADGYWRFEADTEEYFRVLNEYLDEMAEELQIQDKLGYSVESGYLPWKDALLSNLRNASLTIHSFIRIRKFNQSFWNVVLIDDKIKSPTLQNITGKAQDSKEMIVFQTIPCIVRKTTSQEDSLTEEERAQIFDKAVDLVSNIKYKLYKQTDSPIGSEQITRSEVKALPEVTFRELQSAIFETQCQFGQLDRTTDLFRGVELNHSRLLPQEILYPDNELYPDGAQSSANKSMYSQLWADEDNVHKWRNLIITYKGLDSSQQEKDFVYETEINPDGTDDYECSDNWLFRNLVWTETQIEEYADAMVSKMQGMTWFPFEMWCAGLPYLETGDEIEIPLGEKSYTSYVLQRQLKGIQNLQDTYINGSLDIF